MLYCSVGSKTTELMNTDLKRLLFDAFYRIGKRKRVLVIPPDITRNHSMAGEITSVAWKYYGDKVADILPALGTHLPMKNAENSAMFPGVPIKLFRDHSFRQDVVTIGNISAEFIMNISEGKLSYEWPAQVNRLLVEGKHDLVLSIGQVVPHEVAGMAGYNKNIFIGVGGAEGISKSHFLGAVYGIERILGRSDTPVRRVLDYASYQFASEFPIVYILTVMAKNAAGKLCMRGLFIGDDRECFELASKLSFAVNVETVERPIKKAIVYLDPESYRSTWLGNKSIYRTRMAMEDGGELIVIAPGVQTFGEDREIDALIRKYGYRGTDRVLEEVESNEDLHNNLGAAAHLIHGSSEGRFDITYCPAKLDKKEIESVNFMYEKISKVIKKYDPDVLRDGFNTMPDGENVFYISNPALGLWVRKDVFTENQTGISTAR
jgi:nickel-dependent lactate racemase